MGFMRSDVQKAKSNYDTAAQFLEKNKNKTTEEIKAKVKTTKMSDSEKRQILDMLEKDTSRQLNKSLSFDEINNSEKLRGAIYDNTPASKKSSKKDILALSNTKYTNTLLEKILQVQNDSALSENTLKFQQQVSSSLTLIQEDIKQLVELNKPKEAPQTQAERKELQMGVSDMAKAISELDINSLFKEFKTGILRQFDTDGTGEIIATLFSSMKESIKEGSFGSMLKGMIKDAILDSMPYGSEIKRWKEDPVAFAQDFINKMAFGNNAGLRDIFGSHVKGMKPDLTRRVNKIDMAAAATFDNKVHTAITRIIPEQLYRMVSLLSGKELRVFDWNTQTYRNMSAIMAQEQRAQSQKNVTAQIDQQMSNLSYGIEESAAGDTFLKSKLRYGVDGKVLKDKDTGMVQFKNGTALRKVIENTITSGCTLRQIKDADNVYSLIKFWKLDKGFSPEEKSDCVEAVQYLQAYYRSLTKAEFDVQQEQAFNSKQTLHNRYFSEAEISLTAEEREMYGKVQSDIRLDPAAMKDIIGQYYASGARVNGVGGRGTTVNPGTFNTMSDADKAKILDELIARNAKNLSDKGKDKRRAYLNELADDIVKDNYDYHNATNVTKNGVDLAKEQFSTILDYLGAQERNNIDNNRGINDELSWTSIKNNLDNNTITASQQRKMNEELLKIRRSNEIYQAFDRVGLTANAEAKMYGISVNSVKNRLRSPMDLYNVLNDDGTVNKDKLKKFMEQNNVNLEYLSDEYISEVKRNAADKDKSVIGGSIGSSVSKTLSSIFGDPQIANKAGIAIGGAAGLGIAKLLKDQGIITSPKAQWILAAVGGGLMSMERTRKYMQTVFGPEGDIENDQGYTNKQIFFAKAMQKWLPMAGLGGATFKFVNKAFGAFGPVGKIIGLPMAGLASLMVGAAAPTLVKQFQKSLFDRDEKDNSWLAKIGRALKGIPFVQKYFDVTGIQDDSQIYIRTLTSLRTQLETEKAQYEGLDDPKSTQETARIQAKIDLVNGAIKVIENNRSNSSLTDEKRLEIADKQVKQVMEKIRHKAKYADDGEFLGMELTDEYQNHFDSVFDELTRKNDKKKYARDNDLNVADMKYNSGNFGDSSALRVSLDKAEKEFGSMTEDQVNRLEGSQKLRYNFWKRFKENKLTLDKESGEFDLREKMAEILADVIAEDQESSKVINEIASDEADSFRGIIRNEKLYRQFMDLTAEGESIDEKRKAFEQWKQELLESENGQKIYEQLMEVTTNGSKRDKMYASAKELAREYMISLNEGRDRKLSAAQIDQKVNYLVQTVFNQDLLTKRLKAKVGGKVDEFVVKMKELINGYGADKAELAEHRTAVNLFNELNGSEDGGKGSKDKQSKPNARIKMSELSDKKFRTGESLSTAGCSVAALNNALLYMGISTIDVDTLISIANKHLTNDGGVSSNFFKEVGDKIGLKIEIYNNQDNKFTPEKLVEVKPSNTRGVIALLKNKDGNGFHYVTVRNINTKTTSVDDPELNSSNTRMSTGDISVRCQEIITLVKSKESAGNLKAESSTGLTSLQKIGSVVRAGRNLLGDIRKDGLETTLKNRVGGFIKNKVNTLMGNELPTIPFNKIPGEIGSGTANIVRSILDGLKDMVFNIRMIDDLTLPLRMSDPDAARALANAQAASSDGVGSKASQQTKKLIANKDINAEMRQADAVQDALLTMTAGQNTGMIAGNSTEAGGKGTGKYEGAQAPAQSGMGNFLGSLIGNIVGGKGLGLMKGLATAAGVAAMAGSIYKIGKHISLPAFKKAKDLASSAYDNMPIIGDRQEVEYQFDENGNMIQEGSHKDVTGGMRNLRDATNMARVGANALTVPYRALRTVAKHGSKFGSIGAKVGKAAGALADNKGTVMSFIRKVSDFIITVENWLIKHKIGTIGFGASVKPYLGKLKDWAAKFLPRMFQAGTKKGAGSFLKKIPLLGAVLAGGQALYAFQDAYRHVEAYTDLPPDKLSFEQKCKVAFAKALFDAGIEMICNAIPVVGTALCIGWSVMRATKVVTFNDIKSILGVGYDELKAEVLGQEEEEKKLEDKGASEVEKDSKEEKKEDLGSTTENIDTNSVVTDAAGTVAGSTETKEQQKPQPTESEKAKQKDKENADLKKEKQEAVETLSAGAKADKDLWQQGGKGWTHPLKNKNAMITSAFGPRNVANASNPHKGIDLQGSASTKVYAMKDGKVSQSTENFGIIKLDYEDGTSSRFLHLGKRFKKAGDTVKAGEEVGLVGGVGENGIKSYKEHLHLEMFDKKGSRLDPFLALGLDPKVFKTGPHGKENEDYLARNAWLTNKAKDVAEKGWLQGLVEAGRKPLIEKAGTNLDKGDDSPSEKRTVKTNANVDNKDVNNTNNNVLSMGGMDSKLISAIIQGQQQMITALMSKLDEVTSLLSNIASSAGQISNNSMSDFNAPSVIR